MSIERRELINKVTNMNDRDELRILRSAITDRIREIGNSIKIRPTSWGYCYSTGE